MVYTSGGFSGKFLSFSVQMSLWNAMQRRSHFDHLTDFLSSLWLQPWYGYAVAEYILRTMDPSAPLKVGVSMGTICVVSLFLNAISYYNKV